MIGSLNSRRASCVLVDLNTQLDFCLADGARPMRNADQVVPNLKRVFSWAKRNAIPCISSVDSHRSGELNGESGPVHCVDGSVGQRKLDFTLMPIRAIVQVDNTLCVPLDLFSRCEQVIFRARGECLFDNPKADRFLTQLRADEYIIIGNAVEHSVKAIALGLALRDFNVFVVHDACGHWNEAAADLTFRQLEAKHVGLISVAQLVARSVDSNGRYPTAEPAAKRNGKTRNGKSISAERNGRYSPDGSGMVRKPEGPLSTKQPKTSM